MQFLNAENVLLYQISHQSYLQKTPLIAAPIVALTDILRNEYKALAKQITSITPTCAADSQKARNDVDKAFGGISVSLSVSI